jgi:CRISPR-associated protein Csm3
MNIGGIDNAVIKNPIDGKPFIPGSSIKGKMRSLFELANKEVGESRRNSVNPNAASTQFFGTAGKYKKEGSQNEENYTRPARIIVRDGKLAEASDKTFSQLLEVKTENSINRITGTSDSGLRHFERVPAGTKFSFEVILNVLEGNVEGEHGQQEVQLPRDTLLSYTYECFRLLRDDYLGGNGSRGYGQVDIRIKTIEVRNRDFYLGNREEPEKLNIPGDFQEDNNQGVSTA